MSYIIVQKINEYMFRIIITSLALLLIQVTPSKSSFLDPIQLEAVNAVNMYLNNIEHMEGDFIQINPDSTISEGRFLTVLKKFFAPLEKASFLKPWSVGFRPSNR